MPSTFLEDRGVVRVAGVEARSFLQGLVTCDMTPVTPERAAYGALLTPQGKIIVDFIITEFADGFMLDCPLTLAEDLARRLRLYRLRAELNIDDLSASQGVAAVWDEVSPSVVDPRDTELGERIVGERFALSKQHGVENVALYEAHRIAIGIPKGGADFVYGDTFPHEANMDLLQGVDFKKGCYVGQEVVSRVEHRGAARKRIGHVEFEGLAPAPGASIRAGGIEIGVMGSSAWQIGLATLRLDRVEDAKARGEEIICEDVRLSVIVA